MNQDQQTEPKNVGGRPPAITMQDKIELCKAIEQDMPMKYACDFVGLAQRTVYDYLEKDEGFRNQVARARANSLKGLVSLTKDQNGAWKILKNLFKDEFKENIEVVGEIQVKQTLVGQLPQEDLIKILESELMKLKAIEAPSVQDTPSDGE